jgi:hypothetical protein
MGSCDVLRAEVLNMRLRGQRLTEYVNTKWEEMIGEQLYSKSSSVAISTPLRMSGW